MASKENNKYADSSEDSSSQVRSIIDKINKEIPSKESTREVIIRKDGSKAVRVLKKRRVTLSDKELKSRSRRAALRLILLSIISVLALVIYFITRMYMMSSIDFIETKKQEIAKQWQAQNVEIDGFKLEGFELSINSLTVIFAEDSMMKKLVLRGVNGRLDPIGICRGKIMMDNASIQTAILEINEEADRMKMPTVEGSPIWDIARLTCNNFSLNFGDTQKAPFRITGSIVYLYTPAENKEICSINLSGGKFYVTDWKGFDLQELHAQIGSNGLLGFSLELRPLMPSVETIEGRAPFIRLSGEILNGDSFYSPYTLVSDGIDISDLTDNRLASFFSAQTSAHKQHEHESSTFLQLKPSGGIPTLSGDLDLRNIRWYALPAIPQIMSHLESAKRAEYIALAITKGCVNIESAGEDIRMKFREEDMYEVALIRMVGDIAINKQNDISGTLDYGLPSSYTRVEYPDGISDAVFYERGETAWLRTTLRGKATAVADNSAELDAQADVARATRPKPHSLESIDVDSINAIWLDRQKVAQKAAKKAAKKVAPQQVPSARLQGPEVTPSSGGRFNSSDSLF